MMKNLLMGRMFAAVTLMACALGSHVANAQSAGTAAPMATSGSDALYVALGEKAGIRKFTHEFLTIVLSDNRIKDSFANADIERLEGLISEQLCDLSGGPCKYSGRDMKTAHASMGLDRAHFNALAEDLQIAMENAGISTANSDRLIAKLAPMERDVVTK